MSLQTKTNNCTLLLGQERAKKLLNRSLASDRLAHAYLFKGPAGVGKKLFAQELAAAVNCKNAHAFQACGSCPSCKKFHSGNHPDFLLVSPEKGSIKIRQIRELIQLLSYAPYESGMRVVLLEDIHTMGQEAANSLLKTLEEPPENNLLILTANAGREILKTINSRCQTIPFFHLSREDTISILMAKDPNLDREKAVLLARLSEGQPGRAMQFYKSDIIEIRRSVIQLCSDPGLDPASDVGKLLLAAEKMAALKGELPPLLGLFRLWIRDCMSAGFLPNPEGRLPEKSLKNWSFSQLFAKLQAINQAEKELTRNCNPTLVCEVLLFQLQT